MKHQGAYFLGTEYNLNYTVFHKIQPILIILRNSQKCQPI